MPQATKQFTGTAADVEKQILEDVELGALENQVAVPPTGPGTHYGLTAKSTANAVSLVLSYMQLADADTDPRNAVGDALDELRDRDGLPVIPPTAATGYMSADAFGKVSVPSGLNFQGPGGVVGTISEARSNTTDTKASLSMPFTFVTKGATGLPIGTVVRFIGGPLNLATTGKIVSITDGTDNESEEHKRDRIMSRRQFPPQGGNWPQLRETALNVPGVDDPYIYPGLGGPCTERTVLLQKGTESNLYQRSVDVSIVLAAREAFRAAFPEEAQRHSILSAAETPVDLVIYIDIPKSSGLRWFDLNPWPEVPPAVAAVGASPYENRISLADIPDAVRDHSAPVVQRRIVLWSQSTRRAYRGTVTNVVSPTQFDVAWSDPFEAPRAGDWFFPDAPNMMAYLEVFLQSIATLGPGENTALPNRLKRSFRHPIQGASVDGVVIGKPWTISSAQITAIQSKYSEISDIQYVYRSRVEPDVPSSNRLPPNVLRVRNLAFSSVL